MAEGRLSMRLARVALAVLIALGLSPFAALGGASRAYAGTYNAVSGSSDGTNLTLNVSVSNVGNAWYDEANFTVTYDDGSTGTLLLKSALANNNAYVEYNWAQVGGSSVALSNVTSNSYTAQVVIPLSTFGNKAFTLTSGNTTLTSAQLGVGGSSGDQGGSGTGSGSGSGTGSEGAGPGEGQGGTGSDDGGQGAGTGAGSGEGAGTGYESGVNIGALTPSASGNIVVDGANEDWAGVDALDSTDSYVAEWKLARDTSGNVYIMFDGTASTQWDYGFEWYGFDITQNGQTSTIPVTWLADQTGATVQYKNNANQNTPAPYVVEAMIPASYFADDAATIKFVGKTVAVEDIPVVDGNDVTEEAPTTYEGIVIDGKYLDWSPVTKYPANDANGELQQVAMVWDGDMVYLYLEETPGTLGAYHAGTHGNGKYEIITDLGERLVFELNYDGTVSGVEGVESQHVGNKWEIAIPASNLPSYLESISFGMYQTEEEMISDVTNLQGGGSGGTFAGIVYDGLYGDWEYYPHHIIQYATAGTQENVQDASGALYAEDGTLYGHVRTNMQEHLNSSNGREFTSGVTIRFNDDTAMDFYPMMTTVASDGSISWSPQLSGLENGTYEFYIMSTDAWHTSGNISDLNSHDTCFGKMTVTISDTADECEFYLDLDKIADKLGVDANDFRVIAAQFINIGTEWITTAGTSTAPFVGVGLGIGTVACVLGWRKFYDKRGADDASKDGEAAA